MALTNHLYGPGYQVPMIMNNQSNGHHFDLHAQALPVLVVQPPQHSIYSHHHQSSYSPNMPTGDRRGKLVADEQALLSNIHSGLTSDQKKINDGNIFEGGITALSE